MPASYYVGLITAVRSVVGTAWADTLTGGIYNANETATIPFEDLAGSLPLAIMDFDSREGEWAADAPTEEVEVTVYRVVADSENVEALIAKLETLRDSIYDTGFSVGEVVGYPRVSWSINLPLNQYFLSTQKPFYAGAVMVRVLMEEG